MRFLTMINIVTPPSHLRAAPNSDEAISARDRMLASESAVIEWAIRFIDAYPFPQTAAELPVSIDCAGC